MKKIYTFLKSSVLFASFILFSSTAAFSQICGPIVQDFNNTGGSTAGFTGDFMYNPADMNLTRQNVIGTAVYTITTPTYQLPANATFIGYGFDLNGTEKVSRVEALVVYISTLTNQMTTVFLAQFVPNYGGGNTATPCRAVDLSDLPGFPAGGRYRFRFEFSSSTGTGQASQNITFDNFRTNGVISQIALPVNFIGFEAKKVNSSVQLTWKIAGEENVDRYEVERSEDGRTFTTIGTVARNGKDTYNYFDGNPTSTGYYRVRNVDNDGKFKYSTIARMVNGKSDIVLKAFPQPVQTQLTLQHPGITGKALVSISTADGRVVRTITPATNAMQTYVDMSGLKPGMYMLRFDSGDGSSQTMKVVKQ